LGPIYFRSDWLLPEKDERTKTKQFPRMTSSARIAVYVQPRASVTEVTGLHDGCIKIRLAAPPVDGAANAALVEFVAERLGIAKQRVRLVSGPGSRRKVLEIEGLSSAVIHGALL
jgi:uncharacterized protein (TIGR00251 family)